MSNTLNKIHYGAVIQTNSIKTSETIGLYNGAFYYTTDAYEPAFGDSWEAGYTLTGVATPFNATWNTDLMSSSGLSTLGSKIDIIAGGDYAFLQNANVKLVNQTSLGNTVHKTIELTSGLAPIGSTMTVFVIIDGVWFPAWTGIVGGTTFNDTNYTFVGADEKSNATDTLTNTIIGMIDAEVDYTPIGDLKYQSLIAYRMSGNSFATSDVQPMYHTNELFTGFEVSNEQFNGVSSKSTGMVDVDLTDRFISFQDPNNTAGYNINLGDFVRYDSDATVYFIEQIDTTDFGNDDDYTTLHIKEYDVASVDWTFLFGDDGNQYTSTVHDALETISDAKCRFSIYTISDDTGIKASTIGDLGNIITVIGSDGKEYAFSYVVGENDNIVITTPTASNIIKPTATRFFTSNDDLFPDNNEGNWTDFFTQIISSTEITPPNDMNENSAFVDIEGAKFNYFYLTFDEADVKEGDDVKIGAMIKGLIDGNMQWEKQSGDETAFTYYEGTNFSGGAPTYPTSTSFGTSEELAKTYNSEWAVNAFTMYNHQKYGQIPYQKAEEFTLPNVVKNGDNVTEDYAESFSFTAESLASTNIPKYNTTKAYSTHGVNHIMSPDETSDVAYQSGSYDGGSGVENDKINILVKVTGINREVENNFSMQLTTGGATASSFDTYSEMPINFKLNGFCLYSTLSTNTATVQVTYKASDSTTDNSYLDTLKALTNNDGNYDAIGTERDTWLSGLQIKTQQQRYQVVTNLCKQGFVGGFTNRNGEDTYKLVGDNTGVAIDITNANTLRDSIRNFKSSPIAKVYNEFELTGSFGELSVKNVTETDFPNANEDWSDYVVGVEDYADARDLWETARRAYLDTGAIHKAPSDRTKLDYASTESSISVYANEYLDKLLEWTTYPKLQTQLSMPLTADTIAYELLDYVHFNDPIITPDMGEYAEGWITSVSVVPAKDLVNVELTMSPDFYITPASTCNTITEASTNVDTITEASTNTDTITEGNCF